MECQFPVKSGGQRGLRAVNAISRRPLTKQSHSIPAKRETKTITFSTKLQEINLKLNTMKKQLLIIAAAIISLTLNACTLNLDGETLGNKTIKGNGTIVTQNYDVTDFTTASLSLPATVNFTVSSDYTCTVRVDENILECLDIKVEDNELIMKKSEKHKNTNLRTTEFVIDITAPSLENINLAGSGTFNALSPMDVKDLEVNVAGSGDVMFHKTLRVQKASLNVAGSGSLTCNELLADKLDANVAGSGDLSVKAGTVNKAEAGVAGSGDCDLYCDIDTLEANVAGSGDIKARVNGKLTYSIFGSGDIGYYGNPIVEGDKLGHAGVRRLGD